MRIASAYAFESSLGNLQRRQQALSEAQQQLTSGKRVQRVSDDPTAAAQAARAMAAETRATAQQRALDASRGNMQLAESALGDAGELLQQARELVISAGNGAYSASDRSSIADRLTGLREDLLAVANRRDGEGRYLFAGVNGGAKPFDGSHPTPVTYSGDVTGAYQNSAASPDPNQLMPLMLNGDQAFMQNVDPALGTISVFDGLDMAINDLKNDPDVAATISRSVGRFDVAAESLSSWRSVAGEMLNSADRLGSVISQAKLDAQTERSRAEDLDMLQAISDFQNQQTGYDAALKTYSMVQRMSLFDYIK
jgi:flagellar hook-associated protein 3 FlgL